MKRIRILIEGKVQGVFYRVSTKAKADELGLAGWVKNQADGSVLLEAQGTVANLGQLEAWCQQGPSSAEVKSINGLEIPLTSQDDGFKIVR